MMVWVPLVFCMRDGIPLCGSAFLRSCPPLFLACSSTPVVSSPDAHRMERYYGAVRATA